MFSPGSITKHLKEHLPKITNLFSDVTTVSGVISGSALTITSTAHGLLTGATVNICDNLLSNSITAVNQYTVDGVKYLRFTTNVNHDITLGYNESITLTGFTDTGLNTDFEVVNTINRKSFDIQYDTLPTLNGNEKMIQFIENGLNGLWTITKIDADSYSINISSLPVFDAQTVPLLKIASNFRISLAEDWNTAKALYTKQTGKAWLFVIMEDASVSKSIEVYNDARQANAIGNEQRLKIINRFTLDIIQPTTDELSAANAIDKAWTDLLFLVVKIMSGVSFNTESTYVTSLIDHVALEYNQAFYGHGYTFEYIFEVTNYDVFYTNFVKSTSFKDIYLQFSEVQDGSYESLDGGL